MIMEPKQKAQELIDKFILLADPGRSDYNLPQAKEQKKNAKACARICVEEIIKAVTPEYMERAEPNVTYWQSVLTHLS